MQKIISLFKRDYGGTHLVYDEVVEGAEWVLAGEGVATRKYDGTCCLVRDGRLYKRYELKRGKRAPAGFEAATKPDEKTGKQQGWVPVGDGPEDRYHREAFDDLVVCVSDRTFELCGPKVQGNPEGFGRHTLIAHEFADPLPGFPRSFAEIREAMRTFSHEGVVWHHPDGRMVKIKRKDFWRDG